MAGGPKATRIVVVEIAHPGYRAMSGEIGFPEGEMPPSLDDIAIQAHGLVNDLIQVIRKAGPRDT